MEGLAAALATSIQTNVHGSIASINQLSDVTHKCAVSSRNKVFFFFVGICHRSTKQGAVLVESECKSMKPH